MEDNGKARDYEKLFNQFVEYENRVHEHNQKKIKTGLKVNLILPQFFLVMCFATQSSKLVFLILWIVSLFGIAFYLIYVEYKDYQLQELLSIGSNDKDFNPLIGAPAQHIENAVNRRMDYIDDKIDSAKRAAIKRIRGGAEEKGEDDA